MTVRDFVSFRFKTSRITQITSRAGNVICYTFHGRTTLLACKSKLGKVFVRIKLSNGSKVVWHLHICMAKACLLESFAIFVCRGYVQCCWPFVVTEKLASTKSLVVTVSLFSVTDCHIWPAFTLSPPGLIGHLRTQQVYGHLWSTFDVLSSSARIQFAREILIFMSNMSLIMCSPLSTAWVLFNALVLTWRA